MKKKHAFLLLAVVLFTQVLFSQSNQRLTNLAKDYTVNDKNEIDFIRLKETSPVYELNAEAFLNSSLLNEGTTVKKYKVEADKLGFTHTRYQLNYNNTPIHNTQLITHAQSGKLVSVNGNLNSFEKPINSISISETKALQLALQKVNAKKYKWEDKAEEIHLRKIFNNQDFSYTPKAELIIYSKENKGVRTNYYAYKFAIYADEPLYGANVIVDAQSGTILAEENLIHEADVPATATTRFSGVKSFTVDNVSAGLYRLREVGRGNGVETYDMNTTTSTSSATDYTNTSTAWTSTTIAQVGTDAHWGAEMTYDYLWNAHSRNSIDGSGFKLVSYANYGVSYGNAFWNGVYMTYGSGGNGGFTSLDICGHEVCHGLTGMTAGLIYQNESGALNESYSDIFGACIEFYGRPSQFNWLIGEDVGGIRDMANPSSMGDPDTYFGTNWYTGTGDNGGVHTNSGVSNYWFYLLCQGGSGVNDVSSSYTVTPIGMTDAARIAFRALTVYYTSSTNYASARNLSVQAAIDLFGPCSNQVFQTKSAWYAVGVGPAPSGTATPIPNFSSIGTSQCALPYTANFNNATYGGDTYVWDFGDGSAVSTATNPVHTYTANGSYNIKLKAASTCAASPDSITKNAYIVINSPAVSSATTVTRCGTGTVSLNASGSGQQYWYTSPSGTGTPVSIGNNYVTPSISSSTNYYVVNTFTNPPIFGGLLSNTIGSGGYFPGNTAYDSLAVLQPCVLKSVMVVASTTNTRTIELRNSLNTVLQSTVVSIPSGTSTVLLNFNLTPGYGYRLGLGLGTAFLYRNNSGVTFPYNIAGLVNITGSSAGPNYHFYFYNWQIEPANCTSSPIAVTASVSIPSVNLSVASPLVCKDDSLVVLTGTPSGGIYSGTAVSGNNFNPTTAGVGAYSIYYNYTDGNGCSGMDSVTMVVGLCSGIKENQNILGLSVYPNPANDFFMIKSETETEFTLKVIDVTGKLIITKTTSGKTNRVDISSLAKGIYFIELQDASKNIYHKKIIKQ